MSIWRVALIVLLGVVGTVALWGRDLSSPDAGSGSSNAAVTAKDASAMMGAPMRPASQPSVVAPSAAPRAVTVSTRPTAVRWRTYSKTWLYQAVQETRGRAKA